MEHHIETFSPKDIPEHYDLEKKMISSDAVSRTDIKKYADYIIGELKLLKNKSEQQKRSFVVNALSDNKILKKVMGHVFKGDLDIDEAESAINRVRQALTEQLKGKLDEKTYLIIREVGKENFTRDNFISKLVDTDSGNERIYKDQEAFDEEHKRNIEEAFVLFNKLDPHPNVVGIKEYDPVTRRTIYENLNMQDLRAYLYSSDQTRENFLINLQVLKDCLSGAKYLADNDLVLQDIKLENLGLVIEDGHKKGVLFDLEGLVKEGEKKESRMYSPGYQPPIGDLENKEGIKSGEMVYQFGVCLQEILDLYEDEKMLKSADSTKAEKLESLSKKMREEDPDKRIGLLEVNNELEDIINKLHV